jgi:hypothetical protein
LFISDFDLLFALKNASSAAAVLMPNPLHISRILTSLFPQIFRGSTNLILASEKHHGQCAWVPKNYFELMSVM